MIITIVIIIIINIIFIICINIIIVISVAIVLVYIIIIPFFFPGRSRPGLRRRRVRFVFAGRYKAVPMVHLGRPIAKFRSKMGARSKCLRLASRGNYKAVAIRYGRLCYATTRSTRLFTYKGRARTRGRGALMVYFRKGEPASRGWHRSNTYLTSLQRSSSFNHITHLKADASCVGSVSQVFSECTPWLDRLSTPGLISACNFCAVVL